MAPQALAQAADCKYFDWSVDDLAKFKQSQFPNDFYQPFAGKTIRRVRIETGPVFDRNNPKENNWLYRSPDALHINTNPR